MTWTSIRRRWRRALAAAALLLLAGSVGWVLLGDLGGSDPGSSSALRGPVVTPTQAPRSTPRPTATARPTSTPTPLLMAAPVRLVIPAIGVDAPVSVKGLKPDGFMEVPNGPEDVAWYNFTARPGTGGNAVISGHLDYHNYGAAVFWRLKELQGGDIVEVRLTDGSVLRYQVVLRLSYDASAAPVSEIIGPTTKEVVTLITCSGTFDSDARNYSQRLVVRAERI